MISRGSVAASTLLEKLASQISMAKQKKIERQAEKITPILPSFPKLGEKDLKFKLKLRKNPKMNCESLYVFYNRFRRI